VLARQLLRLEHAGGLPVGGGVDEVEALAGQLLDARRDRSARLGAVDVEQDHLRPIRATAMRARARPAASGEERRHQRYRERAMHGARISSPGATNPPPSCIL